MVKEGIKPWLDEDEIRPGTSWQTAIAEQIEGIKSAAVFVGENGLGPWQNEEIQGFLSQFVERKSPVIPVVLPSAKTTPKLPWPLPNRHYVDFRAADSHPLQRLIWGITGKKPEELAHVPSSEKPPTMEEAKGQLVLGGDDQAVAQKVLFTDQERPEGRLYPPLAEEPDKEQKTQLEILRRRFMEYWVDGVLRHSLHNEVLISLGKRQIDTAVDAPWKYTVQVSDAASSAKLDHRDISAIYDATGLLLILGEPGSGKSTTLLDLARMLLGRAEKDIKERVPIVLNLSSWKKGQPLAEWISGELSEKYRVPRKIARLWLEHNYLLPLLDGLDEVGTSMQPDCVAAINAFIEASNPPGLVVCCRLNEYRWLPERLKLNGAICLEALSSEEVSKYLDAGGEKLAALREAVGTDPVLHELAQTPLMLSIMSLASQGSGGDELVRQKRDSSEERRKQIFHLYVEQMFQRKGTASVVFPEEKVVGWLSWLVGKMREHSQSVFLVEGLQPSWLGTRAKWAVYGTVVALSFGLIFGLIFGLSAKSHGLTSGLFSGLIILVGVGLGCWSKSPLKNGIMSGSIGGLTSGLSAGLSNGLFGGLFGGLFFGLFFGLIFGPTVGIIGLGVGSMNYITLVETISWKWNQFLKRTIAGMIVGLIFGLIIGLMSAPGLEGLKEGLRGFGVLFGLIIGLVSGFVGGFTDKVKVGKASPNQGINLSRNNSLPAFLVTGLTFGLIFWLINKTTNEGIGDPIPIVIFAGLIVGLNRGGSAVIKHYALRLILWLKGYTPFQFIKFLDECAKLIFLKKVGGGYIFIHRMLLDYFADLPTIEKSGQSKIG